MILQPVGSGGGGEAQLLEAQCLVSDEVGNAVYVSGDKVGDFYQVTTVDITDKSKMPAKGVIVEKISTTQCLVRTGGVEEDFGAGLTPDERFFVGTDGKLTSTTPSKPISGIKFAQVIAHAVSSQDVLVNLEHPLLLTPS